MYAIAWQHFPWHSNGKLSAGKVGVKKKLKREQKLSTIANNLANDAIIEISSVPTKRIRFRKFDEGFANWRKGNTFSL